MRAAKAFPSGEGGSRISRKRETDEGILGRCGHRPLQTLTMVLGSTGGLRTSVATLVRNDMRLTGGNDNFYFGDTYRLHNWRN